jgi:hypothetical protein
MTRLALVLPARNRGRATSAGTVLGVDSSSVTWPMERWLPPAALGVA